MLEKLILWDQKLFLNLNNLHHPISDAIMLFVSDSIIPIIAFTLFFLVYGYFKFKNTIFIAFIFAVIAIGISDSVSSKIFKPTFKRLRPCKELVIKDKAYLPQEKCGGGKYGFFSSHASNSFTFAMFIWLLFKAYSKKFFCFFPYASLVSYSRISLAKHYPLDLIVGALFGMIVGFLVYRLFSRIFTLPYSSQGLLK